MLVLKRIYRIFGCSFRIKFVRIPVVRLIKNIGNANMALSLVTVCEFHGPFFEVPRGIAALQRARAFSLSLHSPPAQGTQSGPFEIHVYLAVKKGKF